MGQFMSLTLEEQLLLKTSKYQDDKNTVLLLETKEFPLSILEKVLINSTFNDNSHVIPKLLKFHKIPLEIVVSAFWLSINESKNDAFHELEFYLEKIINKTDLDSMVGEFESKEHNIQNIINIIKEFQE